TAAQWGLVILAGICMTCSAYFGIKSLTIVSYVAVPLVAILGTVAMIMAISRGEGTIIDQFAKSSGSLTVIGGAGLVIGSFVSGGSATPDFTRFAKSGKSGFITTVVAFFIGNSLMFFFGAVSYIFVGGNDIFEVMLNLNLFYTAVLVLGLNIWTTNDNALYAAGLGLANIFNQKKKPMVLISGAIGTVLAIWLYWHFTSWLNILNCTLPPVGIILVLSYFMDKKSYEPGAEVTKKVDWFAVGGVILGAVVANLLSWGIPSINGMTVAAICYIVGYFVQKKKA
ncbi:MAG: cytosine permease, partial [Firmicutes bacterium]|nr:cytosine permease [Bacillota bacterium]